MPKKKSAKKAITAPLTPGTIVNPAPRQAPPPPPPKKGPPPPPVRSSAPFIQQVQAEATALAKHKQVHHPKAPQDATHLEFTFANGTVVCGPIKMFSDFSSSPGTMRYGKLIGDSAFRYHPDYEPATAREQAAQGELAGTEEASSTVATKPKTPRAPGSGKREGVCAVIDKLILEGGRSVDDILALIMEQFPTRDPAATKSTIRCRPSHIKKAHAGEANFKIPPFAG